jgi:hypothetical protein
MSGFDMRSEGTNEKHTFYSKFLRAKQQLKDQDHHVAKNQQYYRKYSPL